jgi:carotenoid cleavage dioxygenase-like enzyme
MDHALHHVLEPSQEYDLDLTVTQGEWPAGIGGHVFIIGPSQPNLADFVWAGFGILTRVDLAANAAGQPHFRAKHVVTPDSELFSHLARNVPAAELGPLLAEANIALTNTSPHFLGQRMVLCLDTQRPVEFDPVTLTFRSYVGNAAEYPAVRGHAVFPGIQTTSHPVEDVEEKCLWFCNLGIKTVGTSTSKYDSDLHVVRWDGHGDVQTWFVPGARVTQVIHEVTVSRDYVIFAEVGFQNETTAPAGRGRTTTHPPYTDIYLVAKRDLTAQTVGRAVPHTHARVPFESFHQFADYAQDGDDVTMYFAHSNGWDINYAVTAADTVWGTGKAPPVGLHGFLSTPVDASPVGRYVIDGRTGEIKDRKLFIDPARHWATLLYTRDMRKPALDRARYFWQAYWGCEPDMLITQIVQMYADHPYRVVPVEELPRQEIPSTLVCIVAETMTEHSAWAAPLGSFVQSPAYVPDPQGGDGWVVAFLQHRDRTEIVVFDALDLAKGPVAVAGAPGLKQSFQVHSGYIDSLPAGDAAYRRSVKVDLADGLKRLPDTARAALAPVLDAFA